MVDDAGLAAALARRDGVVLETAAPPDGGAGGGTWGQVDGPLAAYRRTLRVTPAPEGGWRIDQTVEFRVGVPYVSWLFALPLRAHLGDLRPRTSRPWWAPPARLPHRGAVTLAALCALSVLAGYLADLLPTVMTYAGRDYGVGSGGQGLALGVVQVNAVLALAFLARADRSGRRRLIVGATVTGAAVTALGALSPDLVVLTASQVVATALITAVDVLLGIVAVEEMPAGDRAWAVALITMSFGLGGGVALALLPLADLGTSGWRWLPAIGVLAAPAAPVVARHLPDRSGWAAGAGTAGAGRPPPLNPRARRRLLVLGLGAALFALFDTPAGQLQNQYLRTERHWSALRISLAEQAAGTVGGLGTLVGGRLADTRGRRPVAAVAVAAGTVASLAEYLTHGSALYGWLTAGSLAGYAVTPALAVFGAELFPRAWRGRAGGALTIVAAGGGLVGLAAAGGLAEVIGTLGPALAVLAAGPVVLVVLILRSYPETAGVPLLELNPDDGALPPVRD